jgi:hypothetical protein
VLFLLAPRSSLIRLYLMTNYQTRGVLGGAYRGKALETRALLTHLVAVDTDAPQCRGVKADHIVDEYAHTEEELAARPSCKVCARKWDKLQPR